MNPKASNSDHQSSSFLFGLTIGVLGTLLLGTEDGRKLMREIMSALPENLRHLGQTDTKESIPDFAPPINTPEETPHSLFFTPEDPPPPPPSHTPSRPEYLHPPK